MADLESVKGAWERRNPDGPGVIGDGTFSYTVEYGVFRPASSDEEAPWNLRGTFAYPEEAQAYIDRIASGYVMAYRRVPTQPPWEFL